MTSILDRAKAAVPGIAEIDKVITRAEALFREVARPAPAVDAYSEILAGDVDPAKFLRSIESARTASATAMSAAADVRSAINRLKSERAALVVAGTNDALAVVRSELKRIHSDAVKVFAALGSVSTDRQAIDRKAVDEWTRARQMVGEYRDVRATQAALVRDARSDYPHPSLERFGWIRGLDMIHLLHYQENVTPGRAPVRLPYPADHQNRPTVDVDYMRWFASRPFGGEFGVWLPTLEELADEEASHNARVFAREELRYNTPVKEIDRVNMERRAGGTWKVTYIEISPPDYLFVVSSDIASRIKDGV